MVPQTHTSQLPKQNLNWFTLVFAQRGISPRRPRQQVFFLKMGGVLLHVAFDDEKACLVQLK